MGLHRPAQTGPPRQEAEQRTAEQRPHRKSCRVSFSVPGSGDCSPAHGCRHTFDLRIFPSRGEGAAPLPSTSLSCVLPTAVLQPVCQWLQPITLTAPRGPRRSLLHTQYCTSAVPRSVLLYGFKKAFILERHPLSTCEERCRQRLCSLVLGCFVLLSLLLFVWGFLVLFVFFQNRGRD